MTKVDIFSGFLGAGKTTLIKKLIAEAYDADEKIVLIENEFGEIGVDTGFLRDTGIQINEMTAGCICCTLVGDFAKALNQVIEEYNPDRILIEPSGVGKLSDVIIAVQDIKNDKIELNAFTTVVDAKRYTQYMRNFGEFYKNQIEHASTIFFSHQQDVPEADLAETLRKVEALNPNASVVTTEWDQLPGAKMLSVMEQKKTLNSELDRLREEAHEELEHHHHHDHDEHEHHHHDHDEECECGHHHDHDHEECEHHHHDHEEHEHHHDHDDEHECSCGCGHHHHGHSADEVFEEFGVTTSNKYELEEIENAIDCIDECGEVLRAKGILEGKDGSWYEFDYVPGEGEVRKTDADASGMVVVIGTRINKEKIADLFRL